MFDDPTDDSEDTVAGHDEHVTDGDVDGDDVVEDAAQMAAEVTAYEERLADARAHAIAAGRRKAGTAGAVMAGAMLALRDAFEGPPREEIPIEDEAPGEPHDVDRDGIALAVDDLGISAPPLVRLDPVVGPSRRR